MNCPPRRCLSHSKSSRAGRSPRRSDGVERGDWWSVYGDQTLDGLLREVDVNNQNIAAAEAAFHQSAAMVQQARAALFPTLGFSYVPTRWHEGASAAEAYGSSAPSAITQTTVTLCAGGGVEHRRLGANPAPGREQHRRRAGECCRISPTPSCSRARNWRKPISICAPPTRCSACSTTRSPPTARPSRSRTRATSAAPCRSTT